VKDIPEGMCVSAAEMRDALAYSDQARFTCPLSNGNPFLKIAAEEALERLAASARRRTT
jgi:hypothetical protein